MNIATFGVYSYIFLYCSKNALSGRKLIPKATNNPKILMALVYFPLPKTPENNVIIAVRKTIINVFI